MKKIQLIIICLTVLLGKSNAQVTIGTGTNTNEGIPVFPVFTYNYSQNIYLASEINAIGNIATLTYYVTPTSNLSNSNNWTIYMGHTTKTSFASTSNWVAANSLTQVYSGTVSVSGGMVHIVLDTLFSYNGADNLIIAIDENTPGSDGSGNSFYSSTVASNRAISYRNTTTNPNPSYPPTATSVFSRIANVTLGGLGQAGPAPSQLNDTSVTTNSVDLSWAENGTATKWNIQWGVSGFAFGTGNMVTGVTSNSFNLTGLQPGRYYQFYVQADYDTLGVSSWSNPYLFYTIGIPQFKFHLAFEDATGAKDTLWFIWDSLATESHDIIFDEKVYTLPTNTFQVFFGPDINYPEKIRAYPLNYTTNGAQIYAQNYVYPLTMYWDSSLFFNNNLPFTIGHAWLDNDWFFFNNNYPVAHMFNMMATNQVDLPKYYYWSEEQFPLNFSFGEGGGGVGINELYLKSSSLKLYPNPCIDRVEVFLKDYILNNTQLQIIDLQGKQQLVMNLLSNKTTVDVKDLPNGIYFIWVYSEKYSYREKIIKY